MALELSNDETFFKEITDILHASEFSSCKKSSNESKSSCKNKRKTQNSSQKENAAETKKSQRTKKSEREPLKVLNPKIKTPKKNASSPVDKNCPHKMQNNVSPSRPVEKKVKKSFPKIIIYKDHSDKKTKVKEKTLNKRKSDISLSKSWDGLTSRKSHPQFIKTTRVSKNKNTRHSFNDLPTKSSPNEKEKSPKTTTEKKKSPENKKSNFTNLKPENSAFKEMILNLETLFPNIDPEFLKIQFTKFKYSMPEIIEFLITKEKTGEFPTRDDYVRKLQVETLQNKFLENFTVKNFLKIIPDPWEYFLKTEKYNCANYVGHSLHYLKTKYKKHYLQVIREALTKNSYSLYMADKELGRKNRMLKMRVTNRSKYECDTGRPTTFNNQFIHEVAFIENESKIKSHIKKSEMARYKKFKEAEKAGTLLECQSCNDFSLLQDDIVNCPANHVFCKDCVVKYVEIVMEKNIFQFKCLLKCEEKFSTETLQDVLSQSLLTKIIQRNQLEETKSTGIQDLVYCPFCYYVIIVPPELNVFKCFNPSCMMESCRHCKKLSHAPLKCSELEKLNHTPSVLMEVHEEEEIEEEEKEKKKNDSPLKCNNCSGKFLSREESNEMVCPCGATMCSICRQPFQECQHSNGKPRIESTHGLSFSDDDNDAQIDEIVAKDDVETCSNCSENLLEIIRYDSF